MLPVNCGGAQDTGSRLLSVNEHNETDTDKANIFENTSRQEILWTAHACIMALSWGLFVPLAIGASIIRNLLSDGAWLQLHRSLNTLATVGTVIGFTLAFVAVYDEGKSDGLEGRDHGHLTENSHRIIGAVVTFLILVQALTGYFRPKAPEIEMEGNEESVAGEESTNRQSHGQTTAHSERKTTRRKVWELQHRLVGMGMVGGAWYNIHRGISLYEDRFGNLFKDDSRSSAEIFWGGIIGLVVSLCVLATLARVFG